MTTQHWRTTRAAQTFISRGRTIHNSFYTYEKSIYVDSTTPLIISCPIHGDFAQRPVGHLQGAGCPICGVEKIKAATQRQASAAANEFVAKAEIIHGNHYSYDEVRYQTAVTKVTIVCPTHGEFYQTPNDHLCGKGCPVCGKITQGKRKRITATQDAIGKAKLLHKGKYTYNHIAEDHGVCDPVILQCPIHGEFRQELRHHKIRGCPSCGHETGPGWYSRTRLMQTGQDLIPVVVYVCRVFDDEEEFVKIGITKQTIHERFEPIAKLYQWDIIEQKTLSAVRASSLEKQLKQLLKLHRYLPKKRFGGYTECYAPTIFINSSILSNLDSSLTDQ
jgi:hypothetical protein